MRDSRSHDEIVASLGPLARFRGQSGVGVVEAVQLTEENLGAVWEWADHTKPRWAGGQCVGLTFLPYGGRHDRVIAHFGDWVVRTRGGSFARFPADEFEARFTPTTDPLEPDPIPGPVPGEVTIRVTQNRSST
jgi:hypothetical protein